MYKESEESKELTLESQDIKKENNVKELLKAVPILLVLACLGVYMLDTYTGMNLKQSVFTSASMFTACVYTTLDE